MEGLNLSLITEVQNILNFKVRGSKVLVKPSEADSPVTKGGIIIPDTIRNSDNALMACGEIISAGKDVTDLKPGDTVYFYKHNSEYIVRQGNDLYFIFPEFAMLAVYDTPPLKVDATGDIL